MKSKYISILIVFIFGACASVSVFENVTMSNDETYGYHAGNPIKTGYWGMQKSMEANIYFMHHLITEDNQRLEWIMHASVDAPYDNNKRVIPKRFGPTREMSSIGGLLDAYTLVTETSKDTITLYFDIYSRGQIMAPKGLKFLPR